jgi:hypothetical protein
VKEQPESVVAVLQQRDLPPQGDKMSDGGRNSDQDDCQSLGLTQANAWKYKILNDLTESCGRGGLQEGTRQTADPG